MEFYKSSNLTLEFNEADKILIQNWSGFATSEAFRLGIDKTVEFVEKNSVKAILNNTLEQQVVKPEDTQYAASKMPALFQNGVKGMAVIVPKNVITKMSLKKFEQETKGANVRMFSTVADAQKWLKTI